MRLSVGGHKTSRFCACLPARILKVYIEVLTRFSHIHSPDSLNSTFPFQGCILKKASGNGEGKQYTFQGREMGKKPLIAWVQLKGQLVVTSS